MQKTPGMERIELRDAVARRLEEPRDIREIIQDAYAEAGNLEGAAAQLGVEIATLSEWINKRLEGQITSRVVFRGFSADRETAGVA
jgi:hypothetical protein